MTETAIATAPVKSSPTAGMSPEQKVEFYQKKAQMAAREKEISAKGKSPEITPELKKSAIDSYRKLPRERQLILKQLMKFSCSYCEKEFGVPNVGASHGMCERHRAEYFKKLNEPLPPSRAIAGQTPVDLKTISPEELDLGVKLFGILSQRDAGRQARQANT